MKGARTHYVHHEGSLWKLTRIDYTRLKTDLLRGVDVNLDDYGTMISDKLVALDSLDALYPATSWELPFQPARRRKT